MLPERSLQNRVLPKSRRQSVAELLIIAMVAAVLTWVAFRVFPAWDDGMVWLMSVERSGATIFRSHADRPVLGAIWQFFDDRHALWRMSAVAHWLVWFGMGCATRGIWRNMFPGQERWSMAAVCLSMAPLICRTQFILTNPVLGGAAEPVLVFIAVLLLWRERRSPFVVGVTLAFAAILIVGASLVSEYALPAALSGCVLLVGNDFAAQRRVSRGRIVAITAVLGSVLVGYLVYHKLGNAEARPDVRPEVEVSNELGWRAKGIPLRTATLAWQASLGSVLQRVGDIDIHSTPTAIGLMCGLALGAVLIMLARRRTNPRSDEEVPPFSPTMLVVLVAALLAGLLPVATMGRSVTLDPITSHYLLPVLPVGACVSVYLLISFARQRAQWIVPALCGLAAGFFITTDGMAAIVERDRVAEWSQQIEKHLPDSRSGLTVAVFDCDWGADWLMPRDFELTARIVFDWPESKRKEFWAFASLRQARRARGVLTGVDWDGTLDHPQLKVGRQEFRREGSVERVLWVYVSNRDGSLDIRTAKSP